MLVCGEGRVGGPWIWLRKLGWRHRRRVFGSVHSSAKENKGVFLSNCHLYTYKQKQASILVYTVASRDLMAYKGVKMKIMVVNVCCKMWWGQDWLEGEICVLPLCERYCDHQECRCQGFFVKKPYLTASALPAAVPCKYNLFQSSEVESKTGISLQNFSRSFAYN